MVINDQHCQRHQTSVTSPPTARTRANPCLNHPRRSPDDDDQPSNPSSAPTETEQNQQGAVDVYPVRQLAAARASSPVRPPGPRPAWRCPIAGTSPHPCSGHLRLVSPDAGNGNRQNRKSPSRPGEPRARHIRPIPGTSRAGSSTALPPSLSFRRPNHRPGRTFLDPYRLTGQKRRASSAAPQAGQARTTTPARGCLAELHPQPAHASLPRAAQNDHYGMVRHDIGGNPTADHNGGYRTGGLHGR